VSTFHTRGDVFVILYVLLALFWASAILYLLGLAIGIFTYEHQEITIVYEEKQEVASDEQLQPQLQKQKQSEQQEYQYEEIPRANMKSMF
jgi:predicted membrane protein